MHESVIYISLTVIIGAVILIPILNRMFLSSYKHAENHVKLVHKQHKNTGKTTN